MGILVEKNTLQTMMLEILLKDKDLLRNILTAVFEENPDWAKELAVESAPALINATNGIQKDKNEHIPSKEEEGVSDKELDFWVGQHFKEYDAVFKALA
jgi:hypothetical protein